MAEIVDTTPELIRRLAETLRDDDVKEVSCFGISPMKALWRSYRASVYCRTGLVDGEPAAIWGLAGTVLGNESSVWLLTSPKIEQVPFSFIRETRKEIVKFLDFYPCLRGAVSRDYIRAIRFVELLGFSIEESDNQILQFSMRR